ncbi:MAG: FAD-dependent oxidoreductase [Granulosicoccus sp.]
MLSVFDIVVLGAGPAGISAATEAARRGASVCLLDEQNSAGGQIYRNVGYTSKAQAKILGKDYLSGLSLVEELQRSNVTYRPRVTVWQVGKDGKVVFSEAGRAEQIQGLHVILASGAIERSVPMPGWTLPGVTSAGAAQILLKSASLVAHNAVLIGSGPLLYLVATQLLAAGAPPKALVETQSRQNLFAAFLHLSGALKNLPLLLNGVRMIATLKWAGVARYTAASDISVQGNDAASAVSFYVHGRQHRIETDTVLLHQGVIPNTQISRLLGLKHTYDNAQYCFHPMTDEFGQSSHPLFSIAGDAAGIGGAKAAAISGRICALNALQRIDLINVNQRDALASHLLTTLRKEMSIRRFLDVLYAPPQAVRVPADETIVCRCEEVTAGDVRRYAALGCKGPNQTKAFGRSGMGPCQGRYCDLTVTEILAAETLQSQDAVGSYRIRAPLKPVTLAEMASLIYSQELASGDS